MKIPNSDAAIMPPKTGAPTARRVIAPAPVEMTRGSNPRMKAKLVMMTGRNRRLAASIGGGLDVLAEMPLLDREGDDQDAVLRRERDQHDDADLGIDVETASRPAPARRSRPARRR